MTIPQKNLVWLASYPKSGNTWFRIFLKNLFSKSDMSSSINELSEYPNASSRSMIDSYIGVGSSDLTIDEINLLRPEVYKMISHENMTEVFIKTHDQWQTNLKRKPIFPEEITKGVIYLIRNPLDIAISFSYHNNCSFDDSIQNMNDKKYGLCLDNKRLYSQIQQKLNTWSNHVNSWIYESKLPVHVVKYEEMIQNPFDSFSHALDFLSIKYSKTKVIRSIINSEFKQLQKQEQQFGFREKSIDSGLFFRSGIVSDYKSYLDADKTESLISNHKKIMKLFGYL